MDKITVLFARADSVYKTMPQCDVWDIERDARNWRSGNPCIAHPPCRAWGRLRHFANPRVDEMDLARFAVRMVRENGGILEHPKGSKLWEDQRLPLPGRFDIYGGWTLPILQYWFGHKAEKATWLYIVGCSPEDVPSWPLTLGYATHVIASSDKSRLEVTKREREATPPLLAEWLCELATKCR